MTTFDEESVVCGACGQVFIHHALTSTNAFGSPDLDTRPPEMRRSTMGAWLQRCPACGYSARKAAKFGERFRPVLDGAAYRSQLASTEYPMLASTFICAALLAEAAGRRDEVGWGYLHAAWTLDDAGKDELARSARGRAADTFLGLLAEGQTFAPEPGVSELVVADCLRRGGRGAEALPVIERTLAQGHQDLIQKILVFQRVLIQRGDTSPHLIREVVEGKQGMA